MKQCECYIFHNRGLETIMQCPLCKSAPDLLEALSGWAELYEMRPLDSGSDMQAILRRCWRRSAEAIAKVE